MLPYRHLISVGVREIYSLAERVPGQGPIGVEVCGRFRQGLGSLPVEIYSWHMMDDYKDGRSLASAADHISNRLGVGRAVIHPQRGTDAVEATKRFLLEVLGSTSSGIRVFVEIMAKAGYPSPEQLARIVLELREAGFPERAGICLDFSHVLPPGRLPAVITMLGDLIGHVHVSDLIPAPRGGFRKHGLPGEGCTEWPEILRLLRRVYTGPLVLECHLPDEDPVSRWRKMRKALDLLAEADPLHSCME